MGSLVCKIELNKERGITLQVENEAGEITQTAVFDGKKMTLTCKGKEETSVITQTPDSITVKCKTFSLEAETITCKSTDATKHVSEKTFAVESTEDLTLKSSAGLTAEASNDLDAKGDNVTVKATTKATVDGNNTDIKATSDVKISGMNVSAAGTTKSEITGLQVSVEADGTMDVKGAATTVKGEMLSLSGSMVTIG